VGLQLPRPIPIRWSHGSHHDILCPDLLPFQRQLRSIRRVILCPHILWFRPVRHSADHEEVERRRGDLRSAFSLPRLLELVPLYSACGESSCLLSATWLT
jgi:hypothetical protein